MNIEYYYDIIDMIDEALNYYESRNLSSTKFNLKLANGENISIKYHPNGIAHLLGINTDFLRATNLYAGSSYDILCDIVDSPQRLLRQINQGYMHESQIFSDYIDEKLRNFKKICGINIFDIEFIVEYKKGRNMTSQEPLNDGYYMGYSDGSNLSVIGFIKNENNVYYPSTNRLFKANTPESDEFLKRLFQNQIVTTVETLYRKTIDDNFKVDTKQYYYHHRDRLNVLKTCKRYAETYNGIPSTIGSHLFYVEKVVNINDENYSSNNMYEEIAKLISSNKPIDILKLKSKYEYMDDAMLSIVSAHNDSLISKNDEQDHSYKDLITELQDLKAQLEKKEALISKIDDENNKLKAKNELLQAENESLNASQEQAIKILTRSKK